MKIASRLLPETIVSTDETRPEIGSPYLDLSHPGRPLLHATDGHRLVSIPVEADPDDVEGPIPPAAFRLARAATGCMRPPFSVIHAHEKTVAFHADGESFTMERHSPPFPDVSRVVPDGLAGLRADGKRLGVVVGFDAKELLGLVEAIANTDIRRGAHVALRFSVDPHTGVAILDPIRVEPRAPRVEGIVAIMQPVDVE